MPNEKFPTAQVEGEVPAERRCLCGLSVSLHGVGEKTNVGCELAKLRALSTSTAAQPDADQRIAQIYDWLEKWRDKLPPESLLEAVRALAPVGGFVVAEIVPTGAVPIPLNANQQWVRNITPSISEQAQRAGKLIAHELNGGDRADCSYPKELVALLDDPSIDNETALAKWATEIIESEFSYKGEKQK